MHVAIWPDQRRQLNEVAANIAHEVAENRESGDGACLTLRPSGGSAEQPAQGRERDDMTPRQRSHSVVQ
jgi:hypothetical protein